MISSTLTDLIVIAASPTAALAIVALALAACLDRAHRRTADLASQLELERIRTAGHTSLRLVRADDLDDTPVLIPIKPACGPEVRQCL